MRKLLTLFAIIGLLWTSAAPAQMSMMGVSNGPSSGGGGIVFTPTDAQNALPASSSGTFTINIGTASADRIVLVCYQHNNPSGDAAATLNGSVPTVAAGTGAGAVATTKNITLLYAN